MHACVDGRTDAHVCIRTYFQRTLKQLRMESCFGSPAKMPAVIGSINYLRATTTMMMVSFFHVPVITPLFFVGYD